MQQQGDDVQFMSCENKKHRTFINNENVERIS